jgi:hypothetical protein
MISPDTGCHVILSPDTGCHVMLSPDTGCLRKQVTAYKINEISEFSNETGNSI